MKKMLVLFIMFITYACTNGQVKSDYEAFWDASSANDYLVFWEELTDTNLTQLADSTDWVIAGLTITAVTPDTAYIQQSNNDGNYLRVGIVARNVSGIYGMMKTSGFFKKGTIPEMVGSVGIRKK